MVSWKHVYPSNYMEAIYLVTISGISFAIKAAHQVAGYTNKIPKIK